MFLFWCVFIVLSQDREPHFQKEFAETKSFRSSSFVATPEGIHCVDFFGPCKEDRPFEEPSQCRPSLQPSIREVHHPINCSHGESTAEIQNILALRTMLENCKGRGQRMPQVQGPLVHCGRPNICPQTTATKGTTADSAALDMELMDAGQSCPYYSKEPEGEIDIETHKRSKAERMGLDLRRPNIGLSSRKPIRSSLGAGFTFPNVIQFDVQNRWISDQSLADNRTTTCSKNRPECAIKTEVFSAQCSQRRAGFGPRDLSGFEIFVP